MNFERVGLRALLLTHFQYAVRRVMAIPSACDVSSCQVRVRCETCYRDKLLANGMRSFMIVVCIIIPRAWPRLWLVICMSLTVVAVRWWFLWRMPVCYLCGNRADWKVSWCFQGVVTEDTCLGSTKTREVRLPQVSRCYSLDCIVPRQ